MGLAELLAKRDATYKQWEKDGAEVVDAHLRLQAAQEAIVTRSKQSNKTGA